LICISADNRFSFEFRGEKREVNRRQIVRPSINWKRIFRVIFSSSFDNRFVISGKKHLSPIVTPQTGVNQVVIIDVSYQFIFQGFCSNKVKKIIKRSNHMGCIKDILAESEFHRGRNPIKI